MLLRLAGVRGLGRVASRRGARTSASGPKRCALRAPIRSSAPRRSRAFVREYPKSKLADDAGLRLAELTAAKGDTATAARQLEWVVSNHPSGDQSDRARLAAREARARARRARPGARHGPQIRIPKLAPPERREAQRLLAELAAEANDPADQLRWLGDSPATPARARRIDVQIDAVVSSLDPATLDEVASALGRRPVAASVRLAQSERALAAGDRDAAERALGAARRLPLAPADAETLVRLETRLAKKPSASRVAARERESGAPSDPFVSTASLEVTLGVALPLSGSAASFGEEALQGILLAAGAFDGALSDGPARAS